MLASAGSKPSSRTTVVTSRASGMRHSRTEAPSSAIGTTSASIRRWRRAISATKAGGVPGAVSTSTSPRRNRVSPGGGGKAWATNFCAGGAGRGGGGGRTQVRFTRGGREGPPPPSLCGGAFANGAASAAPPRIGTRPRIGLKRPPPQTRVGCGKGWGKYLSCATAGVWARRLASARPTQRDSQLRPSRKLLTPTFRIFTPSKSRGARSSNPRARKRQALKATIGQARGRASRRARAACLRLRDAARREKVQWRRAFAPIHFEAL